MKKSEKPSREERRKKKKSRRSFIAILIGALVLCVVVNIIMSSGNRLETMIVRIGSQEESLETEGLLFKEQTVIYAPADGYIYCEADEDERVKIGETVAYIYKNEIDTSVGNELKGVEAEIKRLSEGTVSEDVYSRDTAKIEQTIARKVRDIPRLGYGNRMEEIADIRDEVNDLIEGRRIINGEVEPTAKADELEALKKRKAELEAQYNIERTSVNAPKAGAFTARVDGLEEELSLDRLEEITPKLLKEQIKKDARVNSSTKVKKGDPVGKIVNSFKWYLAVNVSSDLAEDMDVGDTVDIRFTDIDVNTVKGTITQISAEEGGKVAVVLKSNKYVDMIYSASKVKVELIKHYYEGLKLPSRSIRIVDGKTGVFVIRNDKAQFIPVEVLYNNKEWVIAAESTSDGTTTIKLYDELIVDGKNLYDDKVVR